MNLKTVREANRLRAGALGYVIPVEVPPLIPLSTIQPKGVADVAARALALFGTLAVVFEPKGTFALGKSQVAAWLEEHGLTGFLSDEEKEAFFSDVSQDVLRQKFWGQQESLYGLAWVLRLVDVLDTNDFLPENFGDVFPDIEKGEGIRSFFEACSEQPDESLVQEADFWYCLHWAATEQALKGDNWNRAISPAAIVARRRALEWSMTVQHWDDVALDT